MPNCPVCEDERQYIPPEGQSWTTLERLRISQLSDNDVYAVVAFILSEATIIKASDTMNAETLPKVMMPNRDGFISDSRPELELYR